MKRLSRILAAILAALFVVSLAACEKEPKDTVIGTPVVRVAVMKGPTGMGLAKFMNDEMNGDSFTFTVAGSADEISPRLARGEIDIAAVPANLASVLYHNTSGAVQLLAINTLGVVYLVEKDAGIASVSDLRGKTVYATGKGSTPEYALRHILEKNGLDPDRDLTIEWKSQPDEVVALLAAGGGIAMLPQPYVTAALGKVAGLRIAVDLTAAWAQVEPQSALCTGVFVVRRAFAEAYPALVDAFLDGYAASAAFVNENPAEAALMIESCGIAAAAVAEKAIPFCNIVSVTGSAMRPLAEGFLAVVMEQNPAAVGGSLPGEDFYYGAEKP